MLNDTKTLKMPQADSEKIYDADAISQRLRAVFCVIEEQFKHNITMAKYHIDPQFIDPKVLFKHINQRYNNDKELQFLSKCLELAHKNFHKDILQHLKNPDYHLEINGNPLYNPTGMHVAIKNSAGNKVGPFLDTMTETFYDGYDRLKVVIGYMDKHHKPQYTHLFVYDSDRHPTDNVKDAADTQGLSKSEKIGKILDKIKRNPDSVELKTYKQIKDEKFAPRNANRYKYKDTKYYEI